MYDNLGRLIQRSHPDAGTTAYAYDPAGNITKQTTPLGEINFDYTYYRLTRKRYSHMTGNDVTYTYGTSGTETGRPVRIVDGSGMYECKYDALGNVTDETRTIALPQHSEVYQFRMLYQYDSWGRMLTMTYPDGEKITYTYQWGGDLFAMHGNKNGDARTYIKRTLYNNYGQKNYVEYGNTTRTYYTYDALHRLVNLKSRDYSGSLMQDIDYTFDKASNVTKIANNAGVVNTLGGAYENTYKYDVLHRLEESYGGGAIGNYDTYIAYSPSGRLIGKFRENNSVTLSATVDMAYGYCDDFQPHAVKRMFDYKNGMLYDLRWDQAGNLGQVSIAKPGEMFETGRFLFWTEDNRMHVAADDKFYSYYTYDHSGERRLKLIGRNDLLDVNADIMATYTLLNEPTLYPSAYMVLTNKGYTKHYYAGTERVAARIGGGGLDALDHAIGNDGELQTKAGLLFDQSLEQVNNRVLHENNLECIKNNEFSKEEFVHWIDGIPYQMQAKVELDHGQFKDMVNSMLDDRNHGQEKDVYFYHSDHLGSASWITNRAGDAIQHLQYLPYGAPFVDQRTTGYHERFRFTGKERDKETGYSYFGARYMDHELMTMWLSVDPMADKYPNISPYAYCAWNPVRLVDPDGNDWYQNELTGSIYYNSKVKGADAAGTGAMKGEGWKHLGANGMFSTDGLHNSDWNIVRRNDGKMNYNEWTNSFDMELSLDGDKAKSVMESVGYQQVPTQVITYNDTYTQDMPGLQGHTFHLTYGNEYEYAEKIAYIPNSYRESRRSIVGKTEYGKYSPFKNSMPYANRQTIRYSEPSTFVKFLGAIFPGLEIIHGGHHDYVDKYNMGSISNYRGGNVLIDRILAR